jgi:uncharacterized protein (DUF58 family)
VSAAAAPLRDRGELRELRRVALAVESAPAGSAFGERLGRQGTGGTEYLDHRPYSPGDDPRRIDWKVYARLGDLMVRTAPAETRVGLDLMIDASRSMGGKFRWAQRLAAMLGVVALQSSDSASVRVLADGGVDGGRPSTAAQQVLALVDEVAGLPRGTRTDLPRSLRAARRGLGAGDSDLAVLISDLLVGEDEIEATVAELAVSAERTALVQVTEPADLEAPFAGPTELRDAETGERALLDVDAAGSARYAEAAAARQRLVAESCRRHGVGHLTASTDSDPLDLLFGGDRGQRFVTTA